MILKYKHPKSDLLPAVPVNQMLLGVYFYGNYFDAYLVFVSQTMADSDCV